jgi:hypothetical protein
MQGSTISGKSLIRCRFLQGFWAIICRLLQAFWRSLQTFAGFKVNPCIRSCRFVSAIVGITIVLINRQNSTKGLEQNRQLPAGNIQKPAKSLRKALKSLQETGTVLDARLLNPQPRSGNYLQKVQSPPVRVFRRGFLKGRLIREEKLYMVHSAARCLIWTNLL